MTNGKRYLSWSLMAFVALSTGCLRNSGNSVSALSLSSSSDTSGLTVDGDNIELSLASPTNPGAISAADYITFAGKEDALGDPGTDGMVLSSTTAGIRSWVSKEDALGDPTSDGMVLSSQTNGTRSWVSTNSLFDPSTKVVLFDDFLSAAPATATSFGELGWLATVNGTAAACAGSAVGTQVGNPGQLSCTTGTTATGRAALHTFTSSMALAGGTIDVTFLVRIPTVSGGGQNFSFYAGLADNNAAGNATDGVYFVHDQTAPEWFIVTANNSTRTTSNSGVTVVAGAWTKLRIVVNAGGTSASFYVNGVEVTGSPRTTDLPGSGRDFGLLMKIEKSAGTTARTALVDYVRVVQEFSTAR